MKRIATILTFTVLFATAGVAQELISPEETWKFAEITGYNYHGYAFPRDFDVDVTVVDTPLPTKTS